MAVKKIFSWKISSLHINKDQAHVHLQKYMKLENQKKLINLKIFRKILMMKVRLNNKKKKTMYNWNKNPNLCYLVQKKYLKFNKIFKILKQNLIKKLIKIWVKFKIKNKFKIKSNKI